MSMGGSTGIPSPFFRGQFLTDARHRRSAVFVEGKIEEAALGHTDTTEPIRRRRLDYPRIISLTSLLVTVQ